MSHVISLVAAVPGPVIDFAVILALLALIIVVAKTAGFLVSKIGIPPVVGEIAAGVLLGPSILGMELSERALPDRPAALPRRPGARRPGALHVRRRPRARHLAGQGPGAGRGFGLGLLDRAAVQPGLRAGEDPRQTTTHQAGRRRLLAVRAVHRRRDVGHRLPGAGADPDRPHGCTAPRPAGWRWPARRPTTSLRGRCWRSCIGHLRRSTEVTGTSPGWSISWRFPSSLVALFVVRPALTRLTTALREGRAAHARDPVAWSWSACCSSPRPPRYLGIHFIFGAFLFGAIMPHENAAALRHEILIRLEQISVLLLLPVFFLLSGLKVNIRGLSARDTSCPAARDPRRRDRRQVRRRLRRRPARRACRTGRPARSAC